MVRGGVQTRGAPPGGGFCRQETPHNGRLCCWIDSFVLQTTESALLPLRTTCTLVFNQTGQKLCAVIPFAAPDRCGYKMVHVMLRAPAQAQSRYSTLLCMLGSGLCISQIIRETFLTEGAWRRFRTSWLVLNAREVPFGSVQFALYEVRRLSPRVACLHLLIRDLVIAVETHEDDRRWSADAHDAPSTPPLPTAPVSCFLVLPGLPVETWLAFHSNCPRERCRRRGSGDGHCRYVCGGLLGTRHCGSFDA